MATIFIEPLQDQLWPLEPPLPAILGQEGLSGKVDRQHHLIIVGHDYSYDCNDNDGDYDDCKRGQSSLVIKKVGEVKGMI